MRSRKAQEGIQMYKPYFEPKDLTFLAAVLAQACLDAGEIDDDEREVIAARIFRLAQAGEDDFGALREYATTPDFRDEFNFSDSRKCTPEEAFFCNALSAPQMSGLFQWIARVASSQSFLEPRGLTSRIREESAHLFPRRAKSKIATSSMSSGQ